MFEEPTNFEDDKLERILCKAITGRISLDCRKRLGAGETIQLKVGDENLTINIENGKALLKKGVDIILEKTFVPWDDIDEDYEAMIASYDEEGVDEDWFQSASTNYHSRFEFNDC